MLIASFYTIYTLSSFPCRDNSFTFDHIRWLEYVENVHNMY
jgi:hypothetical protein